VKHSISIVTINLNRRVGLRRTLASLRGQTDRDFEVIVVDGGSTDGSQHEANDFADVVDAFTSESDAGIFDAWNKGVARASGDVIALLNSGDAYHPDVIATVRAAVEGRTGGRSEIFCGNTLTVENGRPLKSYGNRLRDNLWFGIGIVHPAMFVGRDVYRTVGSYEPISIAADTDFVLRCVRHRVPFRPLDMLTYMEAGGISVQNAVTAFSQYTGALARHGFCRPSTARGLAFAYRMYKRVRRKSRAADANGG
jgi:glycosyltransferase involved in cell wall biosynthesis